MRISAAEESLRTIGRWHYRRSLRSRVTLLTTIAVGLAVAFVAVGAFVTVRMQMTSALDESLLDRAHKAARYPALSQITSDYKLPSWALGAADVRIIYIWSDRRAQTFDTGPVLSFGRPELAVANGKAEHQHPHDHRRRDRLPGGDGADDSGPGAGAGPVPRPAGAGARTARAR